MPYTPLNQYVFQAALSGTFAGAIGTQPITSPTGSSYAEVALASLAFAEEVDTLWGASNIDIIEYGALINECSEYWYGRVPASESPTSYFIIADAIIVAVKEVSAQALVAGYSAPTYPPGGGGGGGNATEFQGVPIDAGVPGESFVYVYSTVADAYVPRQLTADDIAPGFTIDSFSASGGTVEVGASVVNPTVSASYSTTPASASVTNTASIDSPLTLTTPFTSGTFVGTFTSSVPATVDTTLTATSPTSVVKQSTIAIVTFADRTFWGIGAGGAISATATGTEAVLNGGLGTLVDSQLNLPTSFTGPTPTNNFIYFLCPHTVTPHTFQDANGFAVPMGPGADGTPTTFSFTNANGAVLSMDLYQSTNALMTVAYPITVH